MQKVIAILLMLLVCTVYIVSIKQEKSTTIKDQVVSNEVIQIDEELENIQKILQNQYPGTPKELIFIYNQIMGYQYSEQMEEEYIEDIVTTMRMTYSESLIALNHYEGQVERLGEELKQNANEKLYLIDSSTESIEFTQDNTAIVKVVYQTTVEKLERTYYIIKENNQWKIHSWEDIRL